MGPRAKHRRHDLDWMRVLAFTGVFFYHCARFFNSRDWHIKNAETSPLVDATTGFFEVWGIPLLFFISGGSVLFALRSSGAVRFLRDRTWRLLVPLTFGILVLAPPQIYLERLTHGEFQGSLPQFLPLYFRDWRILDGNFAWSGIHLWYLEDLFLFTLVLLPLFAALKGSPGRRICRALGHASARPGMIFLWALPLSLPLLAFDPLGCMNNGLSEDVARLVIYPLFMLYGFLVFSGGRIQQAIVRQRAVALVVAVALTLFTPSISKLPGLDSNILIFTLVMILAASLAWSWILTFLGYGMCYLNHRSLQLSYANEALLPFYVLHQPVILVLGYFIIPLALPILVKYLMIAALAFGITMALVEFGVRRIELLRCIFGLRARRQPTPITDTEAEPLERTFPGQERPMNLQVVSREGRKDGSEWRPEFHSRI
jgi:glucan biosynthesis protein C